MFKEIWDLSDTSEDESIVKNLEKDLAKLNIEQTRKATIQKHLQKQ